MFVKDLKWGPGVAPGSDGRDTEMPAAIAQLKAEGRCPHHTRHRQVKYLSNVVEADHGKRKLLIGPVRGFKSLKTAYATIKGFDRRFLLDVQSKRQRPSHYEIPSFLQQPGAVCNSASSAFLCGFEENARNSGCRIHSSLFAIEI